MVDGSYYFLFSSFIHILLIHPGKRRTKRFLHLFKILPCSRTYIWGHRIYNCHRHMVYWLRNGWITPWTGDVVLEKLGLHFSHFIIYLFHCVFPEVQVGLQPLFPGESGVDQLVEIIKVRTLWFSINLDFAILDCEYIFRCYMHNIFSLVHQKRYMSRGFLHFLCILAQGKECIYFL